LKFVQLDILFFATTAFPQFKVSPNPVFDWPGMMAGGKFINGVSDG